MNSMLIVFSRKYFVLLLVFMKKIVQIFTYFFSLYSNVLFFLPRYIILSMFVFICKLLGQHNGMLASWSLILLQTLGKFFLFLWHYFFLNFIFNSQFTLPNPTGFFTIYSQLPVTSWRVQREFIRTLRLIKPKKRMGRSFKDINMPNMYAYWLSIF